MIDGPMFATCCGVEMSVKPCAAGQVIVDTERGSHRSLAIASLALVRLMTINVVDE